MKYFALALFASTVSAEMPGPDCTMNGDADCAKDGTQCCAAWMDNDESKTSKSTC